MLKKLWQRLLLFFVLGAEAGQSGDDTVDSGSGGDDTVAGGDEGGDGSDDSGLGGDLDSLIDDAQVDDTVSGGESGGKRANDGVRTARERAQAAEAAQIRAEATLEAERRIYATRNAPPSDEQRTFDDEERRLRELSTVTTPEAELEKWQIKSNRTLRANTSASRQALSQAEDMRDRAQFDRLAVTKPKLYAAYADRVEQQLEQLRKNGQSAPREALLRFVIGNDIIEGKVKSIPKARQPAARAGNGSQVDRGRVPGARSDVSARGAQSEREKRRERLKGVPI